MLFNDHAVCDRRLSCAFPDTTEWLQKCPVLSDELMMNFLPYRERSWRVYTLLATDMGRLCKKAVISALFICSPPL